MYVLRQKVREDECIHYMYIYIYIYIICIYIYIYTGCIQDENYTYFGIKSRSAATKLPYGYVYCTYEKLTISR